MSTTADLARFDRAVRKELDVPACAWLRQVSPTVIEIRLGETADALAAAVDEGPRWVVQARGELSFCGDHLTARRMLWQAASQIPRPPTPVRRSPSRRAA